MPPRTSRRAQPLQAEEPAAAPAPTDETAQQPVDASEGNGAVEQEGADGSAAQGNDEAADANAQAPAATSEGKMTMEQRLEKMQELRKKMASSTRQNRSAIAAEQKRGKTNQNGGSGPREERMSRKLAKAEKLLDERDMRERGEDVERARAWGYSIEDNERWEGKLENAEEKKDKGNVDFATKAARTYNRQISQMKPDIAAYKRAREDKGFSHASSSAAAAGVVESQALVTTAGASGSQLARRDGGDLAVTAGYDALAYGSHKPDDAALDRVVGFLNIEEEQRARRSRRREEDPDAEITYINDRNKHFNKKVSRYYDAYTQEIRENFERGTAL